MILDTQSVDSRVLYGTFYINKGVVNVIHSSSNFELILTGTTLRLYDKNGSYPAKWMLTILD